MRNAIDPMPFSAVKLRFLLDICAHAKTQSPLSYLFPAFRYHARFSTLGEADFDTAPMPDTVRYALGEYGDYLITSNAYDPARLPDTSEDDAVIDASAYEYYGRILELCRAAGTEVLMVRMPSCTWDRARSKAAADYCEKRGIPYVDYTEPPYAAACGVDGRFDFSDPSHLNLFGADKVSRDLARYIARYYDLPDRRGEAAYAAYAEAAAIYGAYRDHARAEMESLYPDMRSAGGPAAIEIS